MITITHREISSVTAGRLGKDFTPEIVGNVVTEYAKTTFDLMKEKSPNNSKEETLVETPLCGYKINYRENVTKTNPDGTKQNVGARRTVNVSIPKVLLEGINADLLKLGAKIVKAVFDSKKEAA